MTVDVVGLVSVQSPTGRGGRQGYAKGLGRFDGMSSAHYRKLELAGVSKGREKTKTDRRTT